MTARFLPLAFLLALSAGCGTLSSSLSSFGGIGTTAYISDEGNYVRFEHAFTEESAEAVRRRAGELCAPRKQIAIKTTSACTLSKCVTNYQCIDSAEAAKYGL